MTTSEMKSSLQKIKNELGKRPGNISDSQRKELEKAFRIIGSNISKLQSKDDQNFDQQRYEADQLIDSAVPRGPEYIGETEWDY